MIADRAYVESSAVVAERVAAARERTARRLRERRGAPMRKSRSAYCVVGGQ